MAIVLHCPVSLKSGITKAEEFSVGFQTASVHIQTQSSHHVKYEGRDLCRGSSGGAVYVYPSTFVLGLHLEAITEADYDAEDTKKLLLPPTREFAVKMNLTCLLTRVLPLRRS